MRGKFSLRSVNVWCGAVLSPSKCSATKKEKSVNEIYIYI